MAYLSNHFAEPHFSISLALMTSGDIHRFYQVHSGK
jgi:hypothetical protein